MASRRAKTPTFDPRSQAREHALSLLYEAETKDLNGRQILATLVVPPEDVTRLLVEGVVDHQAEIDQIISDQAAGWTLERMPALDRSILRLGVFELLHRREVPVAVILDEAVELAKTFSTDDSGRYVNGVLAAVARLRPATD